MKFFRKIGACLQAMRGDRVGVDRLQAGSYPRQKGRT